MTYTSTSLATAPATARTNGLDLRADRIRRRSGVRRLFRRTTPQAVAR